MSDLTDRMRTCAAFILSCETDVVERAIRDAADLLIEASNALERVVVAEVAGVPIPMEIIEPVEMKPKPPVMEGSWIAPGGPLPTARPPSPRACPQCDSRANKTVRRDGNRLMLICPVCSEIWEYRP